LPLVGEIAAGDLTMRQLEDEIESRLKAGGFLISPQVGVQLVTYRSIYILGEVGTPGSYEYRNGITVITAVALAGGYTARADRWGVATVVPPRKPIPPSIRATSSPLPSGSSDRSPAPARHLAGSDPWQELRHAWLTQISRADRGTS
jgi:SLBB domain